MTTAGERLAWDLELVLDAAHAAGCFWLLTLTQ